jgi:ssDNA-binding replication factor A large subunit
MGSLPGPARRLAGVELSGRSPTGPVAERMEDCLTPSRLGRLRMTGIATLRANQNATIDATITAISPVRDVTTSRGASQVADATLQDETGTISLTLWGEETKRYSVGQKVRITDGWVKDFRGKLQISMGRSGTIAVLP